VRVEEAQLDVTATQAAHGVVVRGTWQKHVLTFLMVFGPGLIVMEADNDAGAVSTYMQAGGQYGLHLLWLLIVLLPICYFVQEMVVRLGIATGKGHAAMIYERFGKWWGHFSLIDLLAVNFLTLVTEFAAIPLALSALGVSPYVSVPVSALGLTLMVVTGTYIACVGAAAAIVLIPRVPLQLVIISVQVFAGLILPSAIIFLQLLLNDRELLGDRWVNRPWNNYSNWTIIVVLFALSLLLAAQVILPNLF